jgi:hypothetical protein
MSGKAAFSVVRGDPASTRGWRSRYYGDKEPAISAMLETDQPTACFWTFFGFDADSIEAVDGQLNIRAGDQNIEIQPDQLLITNHSLHTAS